MEKPFLLLTQNTTGLLAKSTGDFQPGQHFGCAAANRALNQRPVYRFCSFPTPAIQVQGTFGAAGKVKHADRKAAPQPMPSCDSHAPPVTLTPQTLVKFDQHRSLFTKEAFWALLPISQGSGDSSASLWMMILQKLLWLTGNRVIVHSAGHSQRAAATVGTKVRKYVTQWKCLNHKVETCLLQLVVSIVEQNYTSGNILSSSLFAWLDALNKIGYKSPTMKPMPQESCSSNDMVFYPVNYTLPVEMDDDSGKFFSPVNNAAAMQKNYEITCFKENAPPSMNFTQPWTQFANILLIVVFNNPHFESVPFVESLYRPFFPLMVHCFPEGHNIGDSPFQFSFHTYRKSNPKHPNGSFNHECISRVMSMHYAVKGYLVISDDMVVSVHQLAKLDLNDTWYFPKYDVATDDVRAPVFEQWGFILFRLEVLGLLSKMQNENTSSVVGKCYTQLSELNHGPWRVNGGLADIYFIPKRLAADFAALTSYFAQADVFLEIAVPSIMQCLVGLDNTVPLEGLYRTPRFRNSPWLELTRSSFEGKVYLHRTKWSFLSRQRWTANFKNFQQFYCDIVLPWLHDRTGKLPE